MQDVDNKEDEASQSKTSQAEDQLPPVPLSPQERQALLARAPADLMPILKAAVDNLNNTADAEVSSLLDQSVMNQTSDLQLG